MALDTRLLAILACPEDKGPLHYLGDGDGEGLYNPRLRRRYVITDGIPVMLIDEAVAVDDDEHAALMARIDAESIPPTFVAEAAGAAAPPGGDVRGGDVGGDRADVPGRSE